MKKSTVLKSLLASAIATPALFLLTAGNSSAQRSPANDDALVDITTDQTIRIGANIIIFGDGASARKAKAIEKNILDNWAKDRWGQPWVYFDQESQKSYKVEIYANVKLYQGKEYQNPKVIPDAWNPLSRNNYIEITSDENFRSYVRSGDEGKWAEIPYYRDTYAHEFGHILGFDDRYHDFEGRSYSDEGWETNLMSCDRGSRVEQRNIDVIVGKIMKQYRRTAATQKILRIPSDTSDGYVYRGALNISFPHL